MVQTFYQILGLEEYQQTAVIPAETVKSAYKRALLRHHPDKQSVQHKISAAGDVLGASHAQKSSITVDDLACAQKTLSDARLKAEYDRSLRLADVDSSNGRVHKTGLDTVDLDAMTYDERSQTWSQACRCGDQAGFIVTETDLERHADEGEITIGCHGCSLWLRIVYSVRE